MRLKAGMLATGRLVSLFILLVTISITAWAEDNDLVIQPAPDVTSSDATNWKSTDIKIGADFGDASVDDIVKRGITNPVYPRFYVNGIQDYSVPSGSVEVRLHYRSAALGETPPALSDSSWQPIGSKPVTFVPADGPFAITRTWPTDFPSVTSKSVEWPAPTDGEYFHVRSEVVYLGSSGASDEHPEDNVAVSLYESLSGLVDVVLVHDTSGSMGYFSYAGKSYIDNAIDRAQAYVSHLRDNDRFAVVEFSSSHSGGVRDVWPTPVASLQQATPTNKSLAANAIGGLSDGGSTPMGAGLQRAINLLTVPGDTSTRKKVILLLSDGYENSGTPRACAGANPSEPCMGQSIITQLQDSNIKVFSIMLGTSAWIDCLNCVATSTGGQVDMTIDPGITLTETYLQLQQAYTRDDLYSVDRGVSGGGDDSYSTYFEGVDNVLYFVLSWDDLDANLDMQLRAPGGNWVNADALPKGKVFRGNGHVVVRAPAKGSGLWEYRVKGDDGENYLVAVRSDRVGVRLALDATSKGGVGNAIEIKARLTDRGRAITDAKLNATVQVPAQASLNTRLRQLSRDYISKNKAIPLDPGDLKKNPDIQPRSAFISKITGGKPESLHKSQSVSMPLKHIGDGVYSGTLEDANTIAGTYKVQVSFNGNDISRTQSIPLQLRADKIDYAKSTAQILEIKSKDEKSQWLLRVYPADRYGNAVTDTALAKRIKANIDGGHLDKAPSLVFDSTFQQQVIVEPNRKPRLISTSIDEKELGGIGFDDGRILILLILILAIVILIWWWRRRKA